MCAPPRRLHSFIESVGASAAWGRSGEPAATVLKLVRCGWVEGDRALEVVARRVANLETLAALRARNSVGEGGLVMKAILEVVERLNAAWPAGDFDQLREILHPDVVLVAHRPGGGQRLVGRDAVIQSYREFVDQALIPKFELAEPEIDVFGATAIASCPYRIEYEIGGRRWTGGGHDLLVLQEGDSGWRVVWRTLLAGEEQEIAPTGAQEA